jgi:uncharacterized coiled-coil protein SlyX
MPPTDHPDPAHNQLGLRVSRLEELLMFADHRHETLAANVEELSRQVAAMHKTIDQLNKRLKDAERTGAGGEQSRTPEDEIPPHNAF